MQASLGTTAAMPPTTQAQQSCLLQSRKAGMLLLLGIVFLDTKPEFHSENVFCGSISI